MAKIIDPIQSRCVIFKFKGLSKEALKILIEKIEKSEELNIEDNAKEFLIEACKGDVRRLLNTLQAAASIDKKVTLKLVNEILDYINPKEVQEMIKFAIGGDFLKARSEMIKLRTLKGLSALEILKEIYKQVLEMEIEPNLKVKFVDRIATVEFRLVEGSDEELQLEALLAMMSLLK
jgi:replication factor C small subunit